MLLYRDSTAYFQSFKEMPGRTITHQQVYEYCKELLEMLKDAFGFDINKVNEERGV